MSDRQSVVLVTIDSFRTDYSGIAGSDGDDEPTMPTLAGLADGGLVFDNAIAPGAATFASATSFLTGMDPIQRPGGEGGGADETKTRVRRHMAARRTLAEQFADRGYETAAFTANPWTSRYFGFDEGFDRFEDFLAEGTSNGDLAAGDAQGTVGTLAKNAANWWRGQDMFMNWEALSDDIDEWIDAAEEPYFLWVFLVDAHLPYLPPARHRTQSRLETYPANLGLFLRRDLPFESRLRPILTEAYENTLRYTDEFLGNLVDAVPDESLLAVHGDHGEMFGERGMYGHGRQLYEPLVNVPLVVANGPNERIERPFSLRQLPTLLTGLSRGEDDVAELLTSEYVFTSTRMPNVAVRGRDWKYIWSPEGEELFTVEDGTEEPLEDEALEAAGGDLVEWWRGAQSEKERLVAAAADLAESERV